MSFDLVEIESESIPYVTHHFLRFFDIFSAQDDKVVRVFGAVFVDRRRHTCRGGE